MRSSLRQLTCPLLYQQRCMGTPAWAVGRSQSGIQACEKSFMSKVPILERWFTWIAWLYGWTYRKGRAPTSDTWASQPRGGWSKALQPEASAQFTWFPLTLLLASGTAKSGACKGSGSALSCDLGGRMGWIPPCKGGEGQPSSFLSLEQNLAHAT